MGEIRVFILQIIRNILLGEQKRHACEWAITITCIEQLPRVESIKHANKQIRGNLRQPTTHSLHCARKRENLDPIFNIHPCWRLAFKGMLIQVHGTCSGNCKVRGTCNRLIITLNHTPTKYLRLRHFLNFSKETLKVLYLKKFEKKTTLSCEQIIYQTQKKV